MYGVRLHVWGDYACFTRPELKVERVSYDVPTPSAARGILEAIYWKPAIRWTVDRIHVLKPIKFQSIVRNEVQDTVSMTKVKQAMQRGDLRGLSLAAGAGANTSGTQRSSVVLRHVSYVIEAHFDLTAKAGPTDNAAKHISVFNRRAESGQCFHRPCLGIREFPANFSLLTEGAPIPNSTLQADEKNRDLGWMLHDINFSDNGNTPRFFRARLEYGIIHVARQVAAEGVAA
jgi:CRISPR-associated protein Cas5d